MSYNSSYIAISGIMEINTSNPPMQSTHDIYCIPYVEVSSGYIPLVLQVAQHDSVKVGMKGRFLYNKTLKHVCHPCNRMAHGMSN